MQFKPVTLIFKEAETEFVESLAVITMLKSPASDKLDPLSMSCFALELMVIKEGKVEVEEKARLYPQAGDYVK